jgi:ADP-heptose:LPS heptosyltransferase
MEIIKLCIKTYDLIDYIYNRSIMLCIYYYKLTISKILFRNNVNKILVIRIGSLGDVVRSTIIIGMLRKKYPKAIIDLLTSDQNIPVVINNTDITTVYTLNELYSLKKYDWIVNLQSPDPPIDFFKGTNMGYADLLRYISSHISYRLITGRYIKNDKEIRMTNILYCNTEVEEILLTALFKYDPNIIYLPNIVLDGDNKLPGLFDYDLLKNIGKPIVGIFIGTKNNIDRGTRRFTLNYLFSILDRVVDLYSVVIIGQFDWMLQSDISEYLDRVKGYNNVIDLVDRTNLKELMYVISRMDVLISTDSSPIHISMGLGTPVIGLYSNSSRFRISEKNTSKSYILIDVFKPCFNYSYRWKFFCDACMDKHSLAYKCHQKEVINMIDQIPIKQILESVDILLNLK